MILSRINLLSRMSMLILTRKPGQRVFVGSDIIVTVESVKGFQVRIGIDAPKHYKILREEVYEREIEENNRLISYLSKPIC